jgi:TP901 family phage tail tape measure protein
MPEDITQKLGFDASSAIQELVRLRQELQNFKQSLQNVSGGLRKFPSAAVPAIKTFRELATAATSASAAIQSLAVAGGVRQAAAAVTNSFDQARTAVQGAGEAATQASTATKAAADTTATAAKKSGDAMDKAGKAGQNAGKAISISWKTIARVVQAQVIVRAVNTIISSFKEAREEAIQFSVAVAEAFTISGGALGSMDEMNERVRQLTLSLGATSDVVAEGVYQTLSNQVVEAGDALKFTEQAGKLAIATNSDLKDAVNALSSVMNSYGLDVTEATQVSDVLFKTVELGRTRLNEFGSTLGRLAPLTSALGISYQEMAAAVAAVTRKGVPTHTALTQILQVSQKLLRPTEKLQELYNKWGVETGPEAIERFGGLAGVLIKMKDETAGNDAAFSDLLGRVRAIVGALNLTTDGANDLTDALDAMNSVGGETSKAMDEIRESTGRQAIEAWNNLGTEMLTVGKTLAEITTPLAKGLQVIVDNMNSVIAVTVAVGVGFIALRAQAAAASSQMGVMALSVKGVGAALMSVLPIAILAAAAFAAVKAAEAWADWADSATENAERIANAETALTAAHERGTRERVETSRKEFAAQTKVAGTFFTEMSQLYQKDASEFETRSEVIGKVLDSTLSRLMKRRADAVKIVRDAVIEADDAIRTSAEKQATAQDKLDELNFKRRLRRLGARRAATAVHQRAEQTAARAAQAFATAGADEEAQAGARKLSQVAEVRAAEDASHQKTLGNFKGIQRAEKVLEGILQTRISGEKAFQAERTKLRDSEHRTELQRLEETGQAVEVLLEKMKDLADPTGKTFAQMEADTQRIAELVPEFARNLQGAFDFDAFEGLGLPAGIEELKTGVAEAFDKATFDWTRATADFKNAVTSQEYDVPVTLKISNEGFIEQFVASFGEVDLLGDPGQRAAKELKTAQDIVQRTEEAGRGVANSLDIITDRAGTIRSSLDISDLLSTWEKFYAVGARKAPFENMEEYHERVRKAVPELDALRGKVLELTNSLETSGKTGQAVIDEQRTAYKEIIDEAKRLEEEDIVSQNALNNLKLSTDRLKEMGAEVTKIKAFDESVSDIRAGTYEVALTRLSETSAQAKELVLTEELLGTKTKARNTELERSIAIHKLLNQGSQDNVTATDSEKEAVDSLSTAYEGAAEARKKLNEAGARGEAGDAGAAGPAGGEEAAAPSVDALAAQAAAAQQLQAELLLVNTEFANVISSASGLTTAVSAPLEPAIQLRDAFMGISQAIAGVSAAMPLVTGQLSGATSIAGALTSALNQSATAVSAITQATGSLSSSLAAAAGAGNTMAASMNAAAAAAVKAAQACAKAAQQCAGGSARASNGGRFFADGGRGTDTVPAMLTPGEFVVNAKSARNFFPQLQAINAGQSPVYREQGGQVTNIGDVNVTLQGGDGPPAQTIREIGNGLRRELRRKTVKLY